MLRWSPIFKDITSDWIPVDDETVHAASNDDLEQWVVEDLADRAGVREAVRVERVQLLVQHYDGYLDASEDELPRGWVVHRTYEWSIGLLDYIRRNIYVGLWKIMKNLKSVKFRLRSLDVFISARQNKIL